MPTFSNGESGESVRAKINAAIQQIEGFTSANLSYATLAEFEDAVANGLTADDGTTATANGIDYIAESGNTSLSPSLPGWRYADAEVKTQYERNADTNAFTDAEKAKLAGIEEGATAGLPTAAQVKTSYESNPDTNAFTDAEKSKLAGVESGATADQSDAEIETAYNNQVGQVSAGEITAGTETEVRRFSPADVAAMAVEHGGGGGGGSVDLSATRDATSVTVVNSGGDDAVLPAATTSLGGVMVAADKTKLDGVEAGATADQTGAEIVTAIDTELGSSDWQSSGGTDDFATRAAFITWAASESVSDGTVVFAAGTGYRKSTGATVIPDATNWVPQTQTATLKHFGAAGDAKSNNSGGMSSGSNTLVAGSVFSASDVGKAIKVEGAGAGGGDLITTIASYFSATSVILSAPAATTSLSTNIVWGTDDTDAIEAAFAWIDEGDPLKIYDDAVRDIFEIGVNRNIYVDPGFYIYNGSGIRMQNSGGRNIVFRGDDPSNVMLAIFSDAYLIDLQVGDPAPNSVFCYGFSTFGGKGLYLNRQTTAVPQGYQTFDRIRILGHSEMAIGSLWNDSPRWTITNSLIETNKPNTIGVLNPPGVAHSKYYNLTITGCTYKFVLSDHFMSSQIISGMTFFNLPDDDHEADIWIQPVNTGTYSANLGEGVTFTMNRFSSENRGGKPVILIAAPDGVGDYWTQQPDLSPTTHVFRDWRFVNNVASGQGVADSGGGPLIQSYTGDLGTFEIADNALAASFSHILKLETTPVAGVSCDGIIGPNMYRSAGAERPLPCNLQFGRWYHEDGSEMPSVSTNLQSNGGWDHNYFLLSTTAGGDAVGATDWVVGGGASTAVTTGPFGQGTARQVTFTGTTGNDYVQIPVRNFGSITRGQNCYLQFDAKASATRAMGEVDISIVMAWSGGNRTISRSFSPTENWQNMVIPFTANGTLTSLQIQFKPSTDDFAASSSDRIDLDNVSVYAANRPVNAGHVFTQNAGWSKAHTVMHETSGQGELHMWPDWTNEFLRADFAAPTSETAGKIIPLMLNSGASRFLTPTVEGSTTAGTCTYGSGGRSAYFFEIGNFVVGFGYLNWSGHTGTGSLRIDLDYAPLVRSSSVGNRGIFLVSNFSGFTLPTTNSQISGYMEIGGRKIAVQYRRDTGDAGLPIPAAGQINFMFAYEKA